MKKGGRGWGGEGKGVWLGKGLEADLCLKMVIDKTRCIGLFHLGLYNKTFCGNIFFRKLECLPLSLAFTQV